MTKYIDRYYLNGEMYAIKFGGGGGGGLPSTYQAVEYLQSTGTQYINSGIECQNDLVAEAKILFTDLKSTSDDSYIFGTGLPQPEYCIYISAQGQGGAHHRRLNIGDIYYTSINGGSPATNTEYTAIGSGLIGDYSLDVNGSNIGNNSYNNSESRTGRYIGIFGGINSDLSIQNGFIGKLWYLKVRDNSDNLIRDFVPCYRKADNVAGLYDLVEGTFYTNQGTGDFTTGPNM